MVVDLIKSQLMIERKIERAKIDLSLRTEFNLIDAFRVLDQESKGWVTPSELKSGLQIYGI